MVAALKGTAKFEILFLSPSSSSLSLSLSLSVDQSPIENRRRSPPIHVIGIVHLAEFCRLSALSDFAGGRWLNQSPVTQSQNNFIILQILLDVS